MVSFPNCKINLGLRILRKREDGFHDLETAFYPVAIQDALEIVRNPLPGADGVDLRVTGLAVDGPPEKNICVKAWHLLKKDFSGLPPVIMHLHKLIPSGAGLGGGSADGAFTLLALDKKFRLGLSREALLSYALSLGSDCPFFILNKPCLAAGRGEEMEPIALDLSPYQVVIVNPHIPVSTAWAFSQIRPAADGPSVHQALQQPISHWKDGLVNDFEPAVFAAHPEIAQIKQTLYAHGALYASMSGTGSTVYGIFEKENLPAFGFPEHYFVKTV
ncbi:MAG TPA: 4-(cytidine 5'-diphospho)-2-C-methyl-D-erythritol kinase [Flavisolibacter sp.]